MNAGGRSDGALTFRDLTVEDRAELTVLHEEWFPVKYNEVRLENSTRMGFFNIAPAPALFCLLRSRFMKALYAA